MTDTRQPLHHGIVMKLSLSGRLWETPRGYRTGLIDQIETARNLGYEGIEVRYPLLPSEREVAHVRKRLEDAGIVPILCFCAQVPRDKASREDALRVVRTLRALGGDAVRLVVMKEEDFPALRELATKAGDLGVRVLVHLHAKTLCDGVDKSIVVLEKLAHSNVNLLVDPAQLALCGERDVLAGLARLHPWTMRVNVQDFRRTGPEEAPGEIAGYDGRWTRVLPGEKGGFDWAAILGTLARLGYRCWLNVMCATSMEENPVEIAGIYHRRLCEAWPGLVSAP